MSLKLYFHPLASFCHKALIALYEGGIAFEPIVVDLGDERSSAAFKAVWPMAKMPVLRDEGRNRTVAESTVIIEYLDAYHRGPTRFIPADPDRAWQTRMWDRFYDHYVQEPMQKIVTDRLRPAGQSDPFGVEQARGQLHRAYDVLEQAMASEDLGHRRRLHFGRLRGSAGAVLCQHGCAVRGGASQLAGLFGSPDGTRFIRARARGSAALLRAFSNGEEAADRQDPTRRGAIDGSSPRHGARQRNGGSQWPMSMASSCRCRSRACRPTAACLRRRARFGASTAPSTTKSSSPTTSKVGKWTSFPRSVKLKRGETVVFSWIVYKSREHRDRVNAKVMKDERLAKMMTPDAMPFDAKRMIYGGFKILVEA